VSSIREWIALVGAWYGTYGYILVFAGALAENTALLGLLMPGGTLAALGALYARAGTLNLAWVIILAWLGTVLGYQVDYLLGRYPLGRLVSHWGDTRLGRRFRLAGRMRLARRVLTKHGGKAILLSHAAGHMRSFVALSAGATHMPYARFLAIELVAALLWNGVFCALGYLLGTELERILALFERVGWISLALLGAGVLLCYIVRARVSTRRSARTRPCTRRLRPVRSEW